MPTKPRNIRSYNATSGVEVAGLLGIGAVIIALALAAWAGFILLVAWAADAVYSNIFETPDSGAPSIDYWAMVGVVIVIRLVLGGIVRVSRD